MHKILLIPKHNKGSGEEGILLLYNGPQYYEILELMKKDPEVHNKLQIAAAKKRNPHSEVVIYTDANGNLRSALNVGAGYLSGTDPVGAEIVAGVVLSKPLEWMGKAALWGLGRTGNNWARAKLISREIDNAKQIPTITIDNAYKMTDEDWDLAYELALKFGDLEELNYLRALHFQVKSGNNAQVFAHTTPNQFHVFDKKYFGTTTDEGYHGKAFYFGETREATPNMIQKSKKPLGPNKEVPKVSYSGKPKYFYLKGDRRYNMSDPARDFFQELNKVNFIGNSDSKAFQEIMVGQPELIKNARAITYDDNGNFIPLSKRDDFANPDFRYKNGAKILIKKKR